MYMYVYVYKGPSYPQATYNPVRYRCNGLGVVVSARLAVLRLANGGGTLSFRSGDFWARGLELGFRFRV